MEQEDLLAYNTQKKKLILPEYGHELDGAIIMGSPVLIPVCVLVFPRRRGFVSVSMSLSLPLIRWQ